MTMREPMISPGRMIIPGRMVMQGRMPTLNPARLAAHRPRDRFRINLISSPLDLRLLSGLLLTKLRD